MALLDKVTSNVYACGIELSFNASVLPSTIAGWQPFYNATFSNNDFQRAGTTPFSINFGKESVKTPAGVKYTQKAVFKFPENDKYRSERIALLQTIRFVKLKFTNYQDIIIGRNDFNQNTLPNIKSSSDGQFCIIEVTSISIFPSGFSSNPSLFGLPSLIPLTLTP